RRAAAASSARRRASSGWRRCTARMELPQARIVRRQAARAISRAPLAASSSARTFSPRAASSVLRSGETG
ncbi:MAG: hypothetical protein M3326_14735, partial [Actinomycetota bacterium]|nr:hypothetical protein [Actinomycetota bacterium]